MNLASEKLEVVIVGPTQSGKSSLLSAIIGYPINFVGFSGKSLSICYCVSYIFLLVNAEVRNDETSVTCAFGSR